MPLADQELNISAAGVLAALATLETVLAFLCYTDCLIIPFPPVIGYLESIW